jgi:hypothetical protein
LSIFLSVSLSFYLTWFFIYQRTSNGSFRKEGAITQEPIWLSVCLSLFVHLSVCIYLRTSNGSCWRSQSVFPFVYLSISLTFSTFTRELPIDQVEDRASESRSQSICLSVSLCLSVCLSVFFTVILSICIFFSYFPENFQWILLMIEHLSLRSNLFFYLSVCLFVCLSVFLSFFFYSVFNYQGASNWSCRW